MVIQEAIFIGANRHSHVSDYYKPKSLIAYGAGSTIALWRPLDQKHGGIHLTLKGHASEVTCVRFISEDKYMVTAAEDSQVKIWKGDDTWECKQTLHQQNRSITCLAVSRRLIIAGFANGQITIWKETDEGFQLGLEFNTSNAILPLTLAVYQLDENAYLLAVGGTTAKVQIYSLTTGDTVKCELSASLEGHEDWVKSLAFRTNGVHDITLASASQDRYIRLWNIKINEKIEPEEPGKLTLLTNRKYKFRATEHLSVAIKFDALIMGHDDWISSLQWHESKLQLLASTADTSMMVWEPDEHSGIWVCSSRLGEMGSKGSSTATGSPGGFWSCIWFSDGNNDYILTNGKTGSWRMWKSDGCGGIWEPQLGITGAVRPVTDVSWSLDGKYLLATSLDQTTRLFAQWKIEDKGSSAKASWHEFSRPQIHGYDMICVAPIDNTQFVSAGDEKVIRSFEEPLSVARLLEKFSNVKIDDSAKFAETAALPALGLSNKASSQQDSNQDEDPDVRETADNKNISYDVVADLETPPLEDQLQRHTLWPELEKLYGHGYEISCLDVSPDGKLIASACRSNNAQNAVIRIFDITTWLEIKPPLALHNLTITKLRFSKCSKFLLSVSRDRSWGLWSRNSDNTFELKNKNEKAHSRIIWDCDWTTTELGKAFITSSRDKTIKLWRYNDSKDDFEVEQSLKFTEPVTSVSAYPRLISGKLIIAVGLESGGISIHTYEDRSFSETVNVDDSITPAGKINRIRWSNLEADGKLLLGVASADNSARIYSFELRIFK
ncbi:HBL226Wp [Eremothecium sinecaudum]|uniref:Elongator complex protein 2 n=1 Tax=Eremothecium sinecaudum TaxID=45286 RepID=A0A120K0U6_9SACH|nr:HBL226Wp [Eremothecium sinecaudum]AMD18676.1 HBL226Wp [Eremothecium sinecaudum]